MGFDKPYIQQIDISLKKRDSKWIIVCNDCQNERRVSYCSAYNIYNNLQPRTCKPCLVRLGVIRFNTKGLALGRKYHERKNVRDYSKNKKQMEIVNTFGLILSDESRIKQRMAKLGKFNELSNAWEGGKTKERNLLTNRDSYKTLRKQVFERDFYTCQICLVKGYELEMDHIKEWCNYPELRMEPSNCRTLCKKCHKTTDNYGFRAKRKKV